MNCRILIFAGLIGLLVSCEREMSVEQSEKFIKFFGSYSLDQATDVAILENGGFAISGISTSPDSGSRMTLILTDEYGNPMPGFPKYYTREGLNSGANALVVKRGGLGGFLMCGYIEESAGVTQPQKDLFLVRTKTDGQVIWTRRFGSPDDESVLHAAEGISSGFILAGYQVRNGKRDILIMGLEESGDSLELTLNYNNPYLDNASVNYILNTGDYYLCACTYSTIYNDDTDILMLNLNVELGFDVEILEGNFDESPSCILPDSEERFLVLGNRLNVSGKSEIVVHLVETSGLLITNSLLLATISERDSDLHAERFVKTTDGGFVIIGTREMDGNKDIFLQFLLDDYQVGDRIIFGGRGNQLGADIDLPETGGLLLLGTNSFEGNSMISLIRTDDSGSL
jgi:hypothetical protein